MEVNGFVITDSAIRSAFWLLSQLIEVDVKHLELVAENNTDYRTVFIRKNRKGKQRRLDIPVTSLMVIQALLLRKCLRNIDFSLTPNWKVLTGYVPKRSIRDNIKPHLKSKSFLQLDISDAFPSVKSEMLRSALSVLFEESTVRNMFRFRKVRWFRKRFITQRDTPASAYDCSQAAPIDVLWALREIIIWLTMFEDRLPQGAPTSPFLFNLVLARYRLPTIIRGALKPFRGEHLFVITVYADNITISSVDGEIPSEATDGVISAIESQTPFRINRRKTHYARIERGSPNITGLSIGRRTLGTAKERAIITVSRATQRRIRGLLHSAISKPELAETALGAVAYLLHVYGGKNKLPKQIRKPYQDLLAAQSQEK